MKIKSKEINKSAETSPLDVPADLFFMNLQLN